ncbi:MAG: hypothetical protein E7773_06695 [Sphingomonas sp.]|uniref:hypothetical protein n=1 Tax=Sphingomonas sp. TaxID=28214 RepID=UPI0012036FFC|nr:hypothetical protein [Sphingomonas sp.]THD36685.1 MAG: hypothetical protein E7773_06695 [Sphingomonas sp.]
MNRWLIIAGGFAAFAATPAAAQRFGPDYSQRGLPGGSDTISSGGELTGKDMGPVGCIYQYTHRIPRPDAVDLVKNGYAAKTSKQKETFQMVGEAIAACRAGTGWSAKRQDIAVKFFSAKILAEDAIYQGRDLGLTVAVVRALDARLDADTKAAFASGQVDGARMAVATAQLKAAGLDPAALTEEQRQTLAPLLARALWGLYQQQAAAAAYKAG